MNCLIERDCFSIKIFIDWFYLPDLSSEDRLSWLSQEFQRIFKDILNNQDYGISSYEYPVSNGFVNFDFRMHFSNFLGDFSMKFGFLQVLISCESIIFYDFSEIKYYCVTKIFY